MQLKGHLASKEADCVPVVMLGTRNTKMKAPRNNRRAELCNTDANAWGWGAVRTVSSDPDKPRLVHQLRDSEQCRKLNLSKPQFPHLLNGVTIAPVTQVIKTSFI